MIEDPLYVGTVLLTRTETLWNFMWEGWVTMMFSTYTFLSTQQKSCQKEPALPSKPQNQQRLVWDSSFMFNQKSNDKIFSSPTKSFQIFKGDRYRWPSNKTTFQPISRDRLPPRVYLNVKSSVKSLTDCWKKTMDVGSTNRGCNRGKQRCSSGFPNLNMKTSCCWYVTGGTGGVDPTITNTW